MSLVPIEFSAKENFKQALFESLRSKDNNTNNLKFAFNANDEIFSWYYPNSFKASKGVLTNFFEKKLDPFKFLAKEAPTIKLSFWKKLTNSFNNNKNLTVATLFKEKTFKHTTNVVHKLEKAENTIYTAVFHEITRDSKADSKVWRVQFEFDIEFEDSFVKAEHLKIKEIFSEEEWENLFFDAQQVLVDESNLLNFIYSDFFVRALSYPQLTEQTRRLLKDFLKKVETAEADERSDISIETPEVTGNREVPAVLMASHAILDSSTYSTSSNSNSSSSETSSDSSSDSASSD